jgi:beta-lactamase regulating signal transducer with metallopeptidase domain
MSTYVYRRGAVFWALTLVGVGVIILWQNFNPVIGLWVVAIVGIVLWYKAHERELQVRQEMRIREMEHQRKMKELELELEKEKKRRAAEKAG